MSQPYDIKFDVEDYSVPEFVTLHPINIPWFTPTEVSQDLARWRQGDKLASVVEEVTGAVEPSDVRVCIGASKARQ